MHPKTRAGLNYLDSNFLSAPLDFEKAAPDLTDALLRRFASKAAYALHADVLPFLAALDAYRRRKAISFFLPPAVASGSDLACLSVLRSLGVLPKAEVGAGPGLSRGGLAEVYTTWEVGREKRDPRFWEEVRQLVSEDAMAQGKRAVGAGEILVVGDDLEEDFLVPRAAGFRALLLRRARAPDGAEPARAVHRLGKPEEEEAADKVGSLLDVVDYVKAVNKEERW